MSIKLNSETTYRPSPEIHEPRKRLHIVRRLVFRAHQGIHKMAPLIQSHHIRKNQ